MIVTSGIYDDVELDEGSEAAQHRLVCERPSSYCMRTSKVKIHWGLCWKAKEAGKEVRTWLTLEYLICICLRLIITNEGKKKKDNLVRLKVCRFDFIPNYTAIRIARVTSAKPHPNVAKQLNHDFSSHSVRLSSCLLYFIKMSFHHFNEFP